MSYAKHAVERIWATMGEPTAETVEQIIQDAIDAANKEAVKEYQRLYRDEQDDHSRTLIREDILRIALNKIRGMCNNEDKTAQVMQAIAAIAVTSSEYIK